MDLSPTGRFVVGAMALIVIGFALGTMIRDRDTSVAMLGGAVTLLFLASRRGRR